jgi:Rieske Fe-S protein
VLAACHGAASETANAPVPTVGEGGNRATVDVTPLAVDGAWLVASWAGPDGAPVLIVRQSKAQYLALSMQCTHMGCPIDAPVGGVMTCPCHGSQFDLRGAVRRGPARYPLGRYGARYDPRTKRLTVTLG